MGVSVLRQISTRWLLLAAGAMLVAGLVVVPAALTRAADEQTYELRYYSPNGGTHPNFYYYRPSEDDLSQGTLDAYLSFNGARWRLRTRAGSGTSKNSCTSNVGWIPLGAYVVQGRFSLVEGTSRGGASLIHGVAWALNNHYCDPGDGGTTLRWGLFLHSEMEQDGSQGATEPRRWDTVVEQDYKSEGCVKITRKDALKLDTLNAIAYDKNHISFIVR